MLGKLLKYEFMSTARVFIPFYIALLGVSVILKLFTELSKSMKIMFLPQVLFIVVYAMLMVAVFALAYVLTCMRFYKNLLGDEGYLMHTLPVSPYLHIWTKLITAFVWTVASLGAALLSVLVLALRKGLFADIGKLISQAFSAIGVYADKPAFVSTAVWFIILMLLSVLTSFLMFYASLSVGQLVRGHRIIGSIAAYFGFNILSQILSTIIVVALSRTNIWSTLENNDLLALNSGVWNPFAVMFAIYTGFSVIIGVGYYIVTEYMLRRKLNLE